MPFVQIIEEPTDEMKKGTIEAITFMATQGFCHKDLHWRHVGLFKDSIVLIDLHEVTEFKPTKEKIAEAISDMKKQLGLFTNNNQ
jgi:aminoglycoside phosphotransferase family enzyme